MKSVREMRKSYKILKYNFGKLEAINVEVRVLLKWTLKKIGLDFADKKCSSPKGTVLIFCYRNNELFGFQKEGMSHFLCRL